MTRRLKCRKTVLSFSGQWTDNLQRRNLTMNGLYVHLKLSSSKSILK